MRALRYLGVVLMAIPNTVMAALFLATWIDPRALGEDSVRFLVVTILLEVLCVHASGFLLALGTSKVRVRMRVLGLVGLGLLYSIFIGALCVVFSEGWPLAVFWGLISNKILGVMVSPDTDRKTRDRAMMGWVGAAIWMFLLIWVVAIIPFPALGATPITIRTAHDVIEVVNPQTPLALGFLYFGGLVLFGVWGALRRLRQGLGASRTAFSVSAKRTRGRSRVRAQST